uniref:WD repeat domain-containing protein 83 n=1 Tax=Cuerna arida TaxID=1464854 RepID=A0A1B6ESA3_9HEMI
MSINDMTKEEFCYKALQVIDCKQGAIRAVRFNVDGSYCLTCGSDKKLKLWNPYEATLLKTYGGHGNEVLDACSSCDNSQILSCGADKTVIAWDVSTGAAVRRLRGHASHVLCVRYNEESTFALSGSRDNTVMGWDIRSRSQDPVQVLRDAKDSITSLQVTDHEILTGSLDCWIRRYDIRTGQVFSDFVGEPVMSCCFTRDGQCTVVASTDSVIRLFDKDSGELLGEYSGHQTGDYVMECGVDQSDRHVVSGAVDGSVWWWELVQAKVTHRLAHSPCRPVTSLSVHPTQPRLLSAAANTINLWSATVPD